MDSILNCHSCAYEVFFPLYSHHRKLLMSNNVLEKDVHKRMSAIFQLLPPSQHRKSPIVPALNTSCCSPSHLHDNLSNVYPLNLLTHTPRRLHAPEGQPYISRGARAPHSQRILYRHSSSKFGLENQSNPLYGGLR